MTDKPVHTNCIAIIPARGGSKRIPGKNIKSFAGKPIIAYAIEAAKSSGLFGEIMVSTDDPAIAEVARSLGASVPSLRSSETASDFATTFAVIDEVVTGYRRRGQHFEYACCIYPTAPFVTAALLAKGWEKLTNESFDTVFPVLEFSFPIWRSLKAEEGKVAFWWPENAVKRSQDLPKAYHDAGQFYWLNLQAIMEKKMLITENAGGIFIHELDAHDIDNPTDWEVAELKFAYQQKKRRS